MIVYDEQYESDDTPKRKPKHKKKIRRKHIRGNEFHSSEYLNHNDYPENGTGDTGEYNKSDIRRLSISDEYDENDGAQFYSNHHKKILRAKSKSKNKHPSNDKNQSNNEFDIGQFNHSPQHNLSELRSQSFQSLTESNVSSRIYEAPKWSNYKRRTSSANNKNKNDNVARELELERFFPERKLNLMVITWNMCGSNKFPDDMEHLIYSKYLEEFCDLYLFALQEAPSNKNEILECIQKTLGNQFVIYNSVENNSLFSILIGNKSLLWHMSVIGMDKLSLHMTTITKGVAAISFQIFGTQILFINSHLSSDVDRFEVRVKDHNNIVDNKELHRNLTSSDLESIGNTDSSTSASVIDTFKHCIWAGDLNFRLKLDANFVFNCIKSEEKLKDGVNIERLTDNDELLLGQVQSLLFQQFEEGHITFLPSYKFEIGTEEYRKNRTPAYTDRILYKSCEDRSMDCLHYDMVRDWSYSDHKPVRAILEVILEPMNTNHLNSSGQYNMEIYNKCFSQDRSKPKPSTVCLVQ